MMDADVPDSKPPQGTNRHWLVPGVAVSQGENYFILLALPFFQQELIQMG
jgi:hypothetical protein